MCNLCNKETKTKDVMQNHLASEKHRKRANPVKAFRCELCLIEVSSEETLRQHFNGMQHMRCQQVKEDNDRKKDEYSKISSSSSSSSSSSAAMAQELAELRKRCTDQDQQITNLQTEINRLRKFKEYCQRNHGPAAAAGSSIIVKRESFSIAADDDDDIAA